MTKIHIEPKFKLIGHRGVAGLRPENTLVSFSYAAELGVDWIEFDVQLSKDQHWVVMHDETIDRTTNGKGKVNDYTLAQLGNFEAGLWFEPPYPKQPIPSLESTLQLAQPLNLNCNIEIKGSTLDPELHARLMAEFLHEHKNILPANILISSFELPCIQILRKVMPTLPIAYLVDNFTTDTIALALEHKFASINCDVNTITTQDLSAAAKQNIPVMLFTVNNVDLAKYWFNEGVVAIFSDRPDLFIPKPR